MDIDWKKNATWNITYTWIIASIIRNSLDINENVLISFISVKQKKDYLLPWSCAYLYFYWVSQLCIVFVNSINCRRGQLPTLRLLQIRPQHCYLILNHHNEVVSCIFRCYVPLLPHPMLSRGVKGTETAGGGAAPDNLGLSGSGGVHHNDLTYLTITACLCYRSTLSVCASICFASSCLACL